MKFTDLLAIVTDQPVFTSALLRVGDVDAVDLGSQLSRWVESGKLVRLRRGVYAIGAPYRGREPHAFEIANVLVRPSYVSLESALAFHGLIPEAVFTTTSVTTARPEVFETPLGRFDYRHISPSLLWGYSEERLGSGTRTSALVATPEKALLDLIYLRPGGDGAAFLRQLRLDRLDSVDMGRLHSFAERTGKPKLIRATGRIEALAAGDSGEWEDL